MSYSGTEWYEIKADGTLFIKNVDEMSGGSYVCHANNVFGDDQEMFRVDVKRVYLNFYQSIIMLVTNVCSNTFGLIIVKL